MPSKLRSIQINFPVHMEVTDDEIRKLDDIASEICSRYEAANPGRIAWPFGHGFKIMCDPLQIEDDKPIPFDESTYEILVAEREAYPGERNHASSSARSSRASAKSSERDEGG